MPQIRKKNRINLDSHLASNTRFKKQTITSFLENDYKSYAAYVLATRTCPSYDGMKVGARKIMHGAFNSEMARGAKIKMLSLIGATYSNSYYMHGDSSLISAILTKSADYEDNLNLLEIDGQHGSLRAKQASAARYLSIKFSKYAKLLLECDADLREYVYDEGEYLEPKIYLTPIPLVLTAAQIGLGVAYRFSMNCGYNPVDVIDATTEYLKTGDIKKTILHPYVRGIKSSNFTYSETSGRWTNHGEYKLDLKKDICIITDLPYNITYNDIEETLNTHLEKGWIKEWQNHSMGDELCYKIQFPKNRLAIETDPKNIESFKKKLKLTYVIPPNILNIMDENQKLKFFETENDLIKAFVKWRLTIYVKRKTNLVNICKQKLDDNENLIKFIRLVNDGTIKIRNRSKSDLKVDLKKHEITDVVLNCPISKLTDEEVKELEKTNKMLIEQLDYITKTSPEEMFINDLNDLKKKIKDDFKD